MNNKTNNSFKIKVVLAIVVSFIFILSSSALMLYPSQNDSNLSTPAIPFTINTSYDVNFTETGLSTGTQWNVTLNNVSEVSNSTVIVFSMANGTYAYKIRNVSGFTSSPSYGNITVAGLKVNQAISFTALSPVLLSPVDLGTAANFAILAKTGVSNTGASSIIGNIGLSPAAASYFTGFSLVLSSTGQFATSTYVTGDMYAADYANPTPAMLTTAVGDMQTAYTNAQGRTNPGYINLGAGNVNGMTLVPGLYKWSTGLGISTTVTLQGNASSVWIFQIAGTLTVGNGAKMILSGGALPQNIFWSVASGVNLGTGVQFSGNILSQTAITIATGTSLNGRALAQSAVTLQGNDITAPSPPIPTGEYNVTFNETGLSSGTLWSATFNGSAISSTTNTISFTVANGTYPYSIGSVSGYTLSASSGNVTVSGKNITQNITFTPVKIISKYTVIFNETGLLSGTSWAVTFNGSVLSSTTSTISFTAANGTYPYSIGSVSGYTSSVLSGNIVVSGKNVTQNITFTHAKIVSKYTVTFSETGLSSGTSWSVTVNGSTISSTTNTISFTAANGTYPYSIGSVSGYTLSVSSGNIAVSGKNITQNIIFTPVKIISKYTVTFNETGLSSGTSWTVTFNGSVLSSTTNTISFTVANGTHSYSIGSVSGYTLSVSSGNVTVNGKDVTQNITFTSSSSPANPGISNTDLYIIAGVLAAAILGTIAVVLMRKKK